MPKSRRKTKPPKHVREGQMRIELLLDRVRQVLLTSPLLENPTIESSGYLAKAIPAAVLVPIVLRDQPTVLLTQRTSHLKDHPGQVSFPGGRIEDSDASPLAAALREAEEEIGLSRQCVDMLGYLPRYFTGTGFDVVPVVCAVRPPFELTADPFEVADIFEVPLAYLLDGSNYQRMAIHLPGQERSFHSIPYQGHFIWGATAGMIRSLFERINIAH